VEQKTLQDQTLPVTAIKPVAIRRAIGLLWASLAIGVVKTPLDWVYLTSRASGAFNAFVIIVTFAIMVFFIWKIGQGKNWARIVFLVLFLLGIVPFFFIVRSEFARSPASGILSTVQSGLQAVGFFLVFTSPGKEWFQPRRG
jgi:hypothetical protein